MGVGQDSEQQKTDRGPTELLVEHVMNTSRRLAPDLRSRYNSSSLVRHQGEPALGIRRHAFHVFQQTSSDGILAVEASKQELFDLLRCSLGEEQEKSKIRCSLSIQRSFHGHVVFCQPGPQKHACLVVDADGIEDRGTIFNLKAQ